jgi:hypothetical protein
MIFNMSISYFHINSFHSFEDYLMTQLTLGFGIVKSLLGVVNEEALLELCDV